MTINPDPSRTTGTLRPGNLFMLCTEDICVQDEKMDIRTEICDIRFYSMVFRSRYIKQIYLTV